MNGKVEQEMYGLIRISFSSLQGEQHYYYWENDEKIKPYVEPEYQAENEMEI